MYILLQSFHFGLFPSQFGHGGAIKGSEIAFQNGIFLLQLRHLLLQGLDVINLGQGNPDQPTPDRIVRALQAAAENPRYHRYIPFSGLAELKQAVDAFLDARTLADLRDQAQAVGRAAVPLYDI